MDEIGYKLLRFHVKNENTTEKFEFKFPKNSKSEFKLSKKFMKGCEVKKDDNENISEISF